MTVKVAIVQRPAAVLDLAASVERAETYISDAASDGAQLVVFPEAWLTCYPSWIFDLAGWDDAEARYWYGRYVAESPSLESESLRRIRRMARDRRVTVVMGLNERCDGSSGSLYNSLATINYDGRILNVHRKLVPTHTERIVWRPANDASGLRVLATGGGRIGGLICWEHWQPLIRQAMHSQDEQIHIAAWPNVADMELLCSRSYAFEGRCFVLAAAQYLDADDVPKDLREHFRKGVGPETPETGVWFTGGSAVIGPDGEWICEPARGQATTLYAELDVDATLGFKHDIDVAGHYSRPDIFRFGVDRRVRPDIDWADDQDAQEWATGIDDENSLGQDSDGSRTVLGEVLA